MSSANHYKLNKLVRDKSVQRMENEGALVMWRELEQPQRYLDNATQKNYLTR